jgi:uncharacterized protein involved in outer membrane biogenesis
MASPIAMNDPGTPPLLDAQPPLLARPARRQGRWWKWLLGIAAVLLCLGLAVVIVLALSFDRIVRDIARSAIEKNTGLPTQIAELKISFLRPGLLVRGFKLTNTPEFGGGTFLDLPELRVELDRQALGEDKIHLKLVRVNLAELHIVVDEKGRRNTEVIQQRTDGQKKDKPRKREDDREFAGLDRLDMTLGTLRYTDLRDPNLSRAFSFGMTNALIENIKTREELGARLILKFIECGVPFYDLIFSGVENLPQADADSRARRPSQATP